MYVDLKFRQKAEPGSLSGITAWYLNLILTLQREQCISTVNAAIIEREDQRV